MSGPVNVFDTSLPGAMGGTSCQTARTLEDVAWSQSLIGKVLKAREP